MVSSVPRCATCECPAPNGYEVDPIRQRPCELHCRLCYEREAARFVRDAYESTDLLSPRKRLAL